MAIKAFGVLSLIIQDEFHSRLKFLRRGLVGMASAGANDNGSQFFLTLGRADDLNKKHTLFGMVGKGFCKEGRREAGREGRSEDERRRAGGET